MRTFIAIDLSDDNKAALRKLQAELKQTDADVKWVEPENIHLTIKFLGETSREQAGQVKQVLDKTASGFTPFEISLSCLGAFPKLDYPRVIWVGIDEGRRESEGLAKMVEAELEKFGFPKEERPFSAHLTIGRVRSGKNKELLKAALLAHSSGLIAHSQHLVSSIIFYQSTLTPQGPIYTPLYQAALS